MSLTATLRQSSVASSPHTETAFHLQPDYITLHRMLIRYQNNILLEPPSDVLSPFQKEVQKDLRSPLPYHRTKWLHNIEYARTLLLQLEHAAQNIRIQRAKRDAIRDLAEKRTIIKKLRNRIEELGREPEIMSEEAWDADGEGETLEEILGRPVLSESAAKDTTLQNGKPVKNVTREEISQPTIPQSDKDALFGPRHRRNNNNNEAPSSSTATTSGFSNLQSTEKTLLADSRTQEDLTTSLVSMAAQLKQQARAFQGSLELDKGLLDRALEGLDRNVSGMAAASKNMQFLRRMSEGQGWWGRMKLYALIFAGWVLLILMVFVGPKLRF